MQKVAKVLKSNGTDGEILVSLFDVAPEDIDLQEPVFIYHDGLPVPYFIESSRPKGARMLLHLTGVRTLADADELAGMDIFADYFEEDGDESFEGWTLMDENGHKVGLISGYEPIPGNPCILVETPRGEIMLPLHEDLVVKSEREKSQIWLRIPEGLLDL